MTDTLERDPIEARLRATLRAKAAQVVVPDHAFDALPVPVPVAVDAPRPRRAVWLVGVLAVAAAVSGAFIVVGTRRQPPGVATAATASGTPATAVPEPAPGLPTPALLAPSWMPAGEQLWSVTAQTGVDLVVMQDQLFGTVAADGTLAPGLLIELQPAPAGSSVGSGAPVTVRGVQGVTRDSKDAGTGTYAIEWIESQVDVRVTVRGASVQDAIAALDALRPRDADLMRGFDAATDPGSYPLLGEGKIGGQHDVDATLQYSSASPTPGATPDFTVVTFTASTYPGYFRTWIAGARASDGTAIELDPDAGLFVSWPDGRQAVIESSAKDASVMQHIAGSVSLLDAHAASDLAGSAAQRVADLTSLGSAKLADGEITVHGAAPGVAACLWIEGHPLPACTSPFRVGAEAYGGNDGLAANAGSVVVDGHWYVFAVASGGAPVISRNGGSVTDLPTETGRIGDLDVALVVVPDGVDRVQVFVPTTDGMNGEAFTRPGS